MKTFNIGDKVIQIDDEDYDKVIEVTWYIASTGYVIHKDRVWTGYLHRYVLKQYGKEIVDHIDGDPLNNQKANLRLVSQRENQHNRKTKQSNNKSGYTGVCSTQWGWQSYINVEGRRIHIGYRSSAEGAHQARLEYIRDNKIETTNA